MNKKNIIIFSITMIILVSVFLLGLTYGYYRNKVIGNKNTKTVSVLTDEVIVEYIDESPYFEADKIYPGYSNEANPKIFTVQNKSNEIVNFSIKLENMVNTFNRTEKDWSFVLTSDVGMNVNGKIKNNGFYLVNSETIEPNQTITYSLVLYYANSNENQSEDMNKELSFKINIGYEVGEIFEQAPSNSLLSLLNSNNIITDPSTIPGEELSSETEATFSTENDDYGVSYYFRGNVKNNYVNFSGMCWRIVRVQGNGTVKMILADSNGICNSETYSLDNSLSGQITEKVTSESLGTVTAPVSVTSQIVYSNSEIPSRLDNWLKDNDIEVDKLADSLWCNDTSIGSKGTNDLSYNYVATDRILENNLSLKCDSLGRFNSGATRFNSNIGLLTAEEIIYSGAKYLDGNNINSYLKDNAESWWTLTPYSKYYDDATGAYEENIFSVSPTGFLLSNHIDYSGIRPVVVLKKDVLATVDNTSEYVIGTYQNPYIISG